MAERTKRLVDFEKSLTLKSPSPEWAVYADLLLEEGDKSVGDDCLGELINTTLILEKESDCGNRYLSLFERVVDLRKKLSDKLFFRVSTHSYNPTPVRCWWSPTGALDTVLFVGINDSGLGPLRDVIINGIKPYTTIAYVGDRSNSKLRFVLKEGIEKRVTFTGEVATHIKHLRECKACRSDRGIKTNELKRLRIDATLFRRLEDRD